MDILSWILPLGSGFCDAWNRKIAKDHSSITKLMLVSFGMLSAIPCFLVWLYLTGVKQMDPSVWGVIFVHGILIVLLNWLLFEAHRLGDMTEIGSYFSLTPAFSIPVSWAMGFVAGNLWGLAGVFILVAGLYVLNITADTSGFLAPLRSAIEKKASRYMLYASALAAVTANLNKLGLDKAHSSAQYLSLMWLWAGVFAMAVAWWYSTHGPENKREVFKVKGSLRVFFTSGLAQGLGEIGLYLGMIMLGSVPYAIALKRSGLNFSTFTIGIISGERKDLKWRLRGMLLMLVGMLLIVLLGG